MKSWYLDDPGRLRLEREALDALTARSPWLVHGRWIRLGSELAYDYDMVVGGRTYGLRLVYPDLFPDAAAWVLTRDGERISGHQFPSGVLCLEHRADNWHAGITGSMLVESAHRLVSVERPGPEFGPGVVPSAHHETQGERLRRNNRRGIISVDGARLLGTIAMGQLAAVSFAMPLEAEFTRMILATVERDGQVVRVADVPDYDAFKTLRTIPFKGYAYRADWAHLRETFITNAELFLYLRSKDFDVPQPNEDGTHVSFQMLLVGADGPLRMFSVSTDPAAAPTECALLVADDSRQRLPEAMAEIGAKSVAIIGCGSVGSKIAASLARSGVKKFLLVDHDILLPGNLVRNELDWWHVGLHKVYALRDRLNLMAGRVQVEVIDVAAGSAFNVRYMNIAYEQIGACDVIIDASARPVVYERLAGIARRRGRAMIWGELFAGGIGGIVARSRPGKDIAPLAVREAILRYMETLSPAPHRAALDYDDVDTASPVVASDAEITFLASVMTQMAIDTLIDPEASRFPHAAYLFGLRTEWEFRGPFDFIPVGTPDVLRDSRLSAPDPARAAAESEAESFVRGLDAGS